MSAFWLNFASKKNTLFRSVAFFLLPTNLPTYLPTNNRFFYYLVVSKRLILGR
jgi:hypothetical protein